MRANLIIFFIYLITVNSVFAQFPLLGYKSKDFDAFEGKKLSVVLIGEKGMDEAMRAAFTKHWNFSEVDFISYQDAQTAISDENRYFFMPFEVETTTMMSSWSISRTNKYCVLTRGNFTKRGVINKEKWLFTLPMDFWNQEQEIEQMAYRMEPFVKLMNDAMIAIRKKEIKINSGKDGGEFMVEEFSANISKLENKTLLIDQSIVRPDGDSKSEVTRVQNSSATEEEIKETYPFAFNVVPKDAIISALSERSQGTAILFSIAFVNQIIVVFDAESLEALYYTYNVSGLSLDKKAYKKFPFDK